MRVRRKKSRQEKPLVNRNRWRTEAERADIVKKVEALIMGGATQQAALTEVGIGFRTFKRWSGHGHARASGEGWAARVVRRAVRAFISRPDVRVNNLEDKLTDFILRLHV